MVKKTSSNCACGKIAYRQIANHDWVCDECLELQRQGIHEHYANHGRREKCTEEPEETEDTGLSIVSSAMERLEKMLKSVDSSA